MSHHYIEFTDVRYTYPNGYEALKGVSFRISHGEKVALLGLNGAGKSTLLLHTNGLLLPTSGTVDIGGTPVTKKTLPSVRRSVGMVFQNPDDQLFMPTVEEDVAFGPMNMKLPPEEVARRISEALRSVNAEHLMKSSPAELSGGQKRAVAIATVLSMYPDILVLDEPTSNLDPPSRTAVTEIINTFLHTCLIATHDINLVRNTCSRVIMIEDGRIVANTSTDRFMNDTELLNRLGL